MIDVTQQINAVRRQVGTRVLEAGEARTVTVSQSYNAAVEDVWDACTNPERIPRWFLPITGDLRPGGRYQLQGNARRDDRALRPAEKLRRHLGVRRPGELDRGAADGQSRRAGPSWRSSTSPMWTTSNGPSSVPARSASGGTWDSWAWPFTCRPGGPWTRGRAWPGPRPPRARSSCRWPASGGATPASPPVLHRRSRGPGGGGPDHRRLHGHRRAERGGPPAAGRAAPSAVVIWRQSAMWTRA